MKRKILKSDNNKDFCIVEKQNGKITALYYESGTTNQVKYILKQKTLREAIKYVKNSDYMNYN